jgi:hypothetical protein
MYERIVTIVRTPVLHNGDYTNEWKRLTDLHLPIEVMDRVWLGSSDDAANNYFLGDERISHVVNCADESARGSLYVRGKALKYACLNAIDSLGYPLIATHYPLFKGMMDFALDSDPEHRVFVHCRMGLNRSVALLALYTAERTGTDLADVVHQMWQRRPGILENDAFIQQMTAWRAGGVAPRDPLDS